MLLQLLRAKINLLSKRWLALIQFAAHVDTLSALARKHEHDWRILRLLDLYSDVSRIAGLKRRHGMGVVAANHRPPMRELAPAGLQRKSYVGKIDFAIPLQMARQISRRALEPRSGLR